MLAANGVAALRIHYRGTGDIDGADAAMTFGTMREDALAAASHVLEELSPLGVAFLGTRLGALFAASAAARHEGAPLILWEPVLEARRYFREAWRARAIFGIKEGTPQAGKSLVDVLAAEGVVDVLGYPVYPALYESAIERTLLEEAGGGTRPVLNVQGAGSAARQADLERMTEALRTNGCPVDVEVLPFEIVGWFLGPARIREVQPHVSTLVARTSSWLQQLEGGSAP